MKKIIFAATITLLVLLPLYARSLLEARRYLSAAQSELAARSMEAAIADLRRAVSWNSPFNVSSQSAVVALRSIAFDPAIAVDFRLSALQELLRGLRSSRSILRPSAKDDALQVEIRAEIDKVSGVSPTPLPVHAEQVPDPRYEYQLLAQLLFWCWIVAVLWSILRGFNADGTIKRRELVRGLSLSMLLYAFWLLTLIQA